MLVDWLTTWLLVRISPVELMSVPVPAARLDPTVVLMSTIAGSTLAAIALAVPLPADGVVPGVAAWMGVSGVVVAWATGRLFTTRARLQPIPAPATAATTAMSTTKAAMRCHTEVGGGGGAAIHGGGGPVRSVPGGSQFGSGAVGRPCPSSWGFCSDISLYLR